MGWWQGDAVTFQGQAVEELHGRHGLTVTAACDLLGRSRQAYYKRKTDGEERLAREMRIVKAVREIHEHREQLSTKIRKRQFVSR